MPSVVKASISWVTFMVPSCAAKPEPVRPAMMMPVMIAAHLAHHGDRHQVRDVDLRAEAQKLNGADERQDHADQNADERDDRQRMGATFLDEHREILAAQAGPTARQARSRQRHFPEKGE